MNQETDTRDHQQHDGGKRIKLKTHIDIKIAHRSVGKMKGAGRQPGVKRCCESVSGLAEQFEEASDGPNKRNTRKPDRNQGHRGILQLATEKKLDESSYRGQQRDEPNAR